MHPHPPLHCQLLRRITHILGRLDFVGVSNVPLVCLNSLPWVQKMMQNFVEYFDIHELTRGVGTLDPHQVPPQDTHAQLVVEGGFPCIFVDVNQFPFVAAPFWGTQKLVPSTVIRQSLRISPFFQLSKLICGEEAAVAGGVDEVRQRRWTAMASAGRGGHWTLLPLITTSINKCKKIKQPYHYVDQPRDGLDVGLDPFAMGFLTNGAGRRTSDRAPWALLGVHLQEIKCPKQMLQPALLGAQVILDNEIPEDLHNPHACSKELIELPRLC
jgi:hypothetical protein